MRLRGIVFKERDSTMIRRIHELRILNTEQITWLFFPNYGTARNRLNQFEKEGYLRKVRPGGPFSRCSWTLGLETRKRSGFRPSEFDSTFSVAHQVGLNWVYCGLVGRGEINAKWIKWRDGNGVKYPAADSWIRPDAVIKSVKNKTTVMLEYDNDTKTLPRIHENLNNYLSWWQMHPSDQRCILFYAVQDRARGEAIERYWIELTEGTSRLELRWGLARDSSRILSSELRIPDVGMGSRWSGNDVSPDAARVLTNFDREFGKMVVAFRLPETTAVQMFRELAHHCRRSLE